MLGAWERGKCVIITPILQTGKARRWDRVAGRESHNESLRSATRNCFLIPGLVFHAPCFLLRSTISVKVSL